MMEWRKGYLDVLLVPLSILCGLSYHLYLWYHVKNSPLSTTIGINSIGRKLWALSMIKDNEKKNIVAVQTLRNNVMGSTLMATTCVLLCSGLAALLSSTYSVKKPLNDSVYGGHGETMVALKYVTLLVFFMISFFCHSLSVRFLNQVNYLINTVNLCAASSLSPVITQDYVCDLLDKAFLFNTVGNRVFYIAFPLLFWIFGPLPVFIISAAIIPVLYNLDFLIASAEDSMPSKVNAELQVDHHRASV